MINAYIIPAAREDADRKNIMLEIENLPNGVAWRTYRQGSGEVQSGLRTFDKDVYLFTLLDGFRILLDSRDRSILYAESMEDVRRAVVPNPYNPKLLDILLNEIDRAYKVAEPLSLEEVEVRSMNKDPIDDEFFTWAREMLSPPSEWKELLVDIPK